MPDTGLKLDLAFGHILRKDTHIKLGAYIGKGVTDQPQWKRPDFTDPVTGIVQGIGLFVFAVGVELRIGADIGGQYFYISREPGFTG